tara:strand:+ start:109 stop:555 length:447 start_codon:yes stop_codon:yes gene_type:complete
MIICKKCGEKKSCSQYYRDQKSKSGFRSSCKHCDKLQRGRHITPVHKRKRSTINGLPPDGITIAMKARYIDESKLGKPCHSCGEFHHPKAMDYHHLDEATKSFNLSQIKRTKTDEVTIEMVIREIQKCILLCATCHRKLHYEALCLLP